MCKVKARLPKVSGEKTHYTGFAFSAIDITAGHWVYIREISAIPQDTQRFPVPPHCWCHTQQHTAWSWHSPASPCLLLGTFPGQTRGSALSSPLSSPSPPSPAASSKPQTEATGLSLQSDCQFAPQRCQAGTLLFC